MRHITLQYFIHNFIILLYTIFQIINIFRKNIGIKYHYILLLYIIDEVPAKIDYLSEIQTLKSLSLWFALLMIRLQSSEVSPSWRKRTVQIQAAAFARFAK